MHIKKVLNLLSSVLFFIAAIMLIPTALSIYYKEYLALQSFVVTIALILIFSLFSKLFSKGSNLNEVSQRDGFLFTSLTWIMASVFGCIPFVLTKTLPNYSDAFFEVISGFTTTGASRLTDVEDCFKSILFWRSLTNWLGGMGIVVLFVALLPTLGTGAGGFNLMGAETVGPVKGKLTPKTKTTASILWIIYLGLTLIQTILLLFSGIGLFDSLTISFSTVSTAGFCIKNASIGAYDSAYIDVVVTFFMFLASLNFSLYYKALNGKIKDIVKDTELRTFVTISFSASIFGAFYLFFNHIYDSFANCLRYMSFHVASIISTTGFSNTSFLSWPTFTVMILISLMFVGGCSGSTGGGIKTVRIYVLYKSAQNSIKKKIRPNAVYTLSINDQTVSESTVFSILAFCTIYIITWLLGALIISLSGVSIIDCFSSTLLTIGNIGLGFGGQAFSNYPHWTNWVFSFLMLSGRLELLTVYVLFSRSFYKA